MERVILSTNSPRLHLVVQTLEATISSSKEVAGMIRNTEIPNDDIISDILARLLPLTKKLKSLVYGYVIDEQIEGPDIIDTRGIGSLLAVRYSLTHLKITYKLGLIEIDCGADACVKGWCCLRDMVALERLETTFSVLLGCSADKAPKLAHVHPPGIVQVRLESDPWDLDLCMMVNVARAINKP